MSKKFLILALFIGVSFGIGVQNASADWTAEYWNLEEGYTGYKSEN